MRKLNETTANLALAQAREIPNWQKPAPKRQKAKGKHKAFSFRALFKRGEIAE